MGVLTCPLPSEEPPQGCSAARMWRSACSTLVAPDSEEAWEEIEEASPPDTLWHSLKNCVSYQAGVWQNLLTKGIGDVIQPAAFKLAIVMRHTPTDLVVRLLSDLLRLHPQSQDLTSYIVALLTDDEAHSWGSGSSTTSPSESSSSVSAGPTPPPLPDSSTPDDGIDPPEITDSSTSTSTTTTPTPAGPAPLRDLQLFGDCELAVLAASREEYDAHAKLVRAEYSKLSQRNYVELRVKVLNQLSQIPKLFNSPEFECFESAARENIEREICTLREHLLTGRAESS